MDEIRTYLGYSLMGIAILIYLLGIGIFFSFGAIILFFLGYHLRNVSPTVQDNPNSV
ncbi:MAG: hypothetical protein ACFFB5_22295 [Promethearchaeota archaeon]